MSPSELKDRYGLWDIVAVSRAQQEYGEDVRARLFPRILFLLDALYSAEVLTEKEATTVETFLMLESDARWWLDRKDESPDDLLWNILASQPVTL